MSMKLTTKKSRHSDLVLEKYWITQCGWLHICTTVSRGIIITNGWKIFFYEIKREKYEIFTEIR